MGRDPAAADGSGDGSGDESCRPPDAAGTGDSQPKIPEFFLNLSLTLYVDIRQIVRASRVTTRYSVEWPAGILSKETSADQAGRALTHAIAIVALEPVEDLAAQALRIAIERDHPVYDCCYVALAMRDSVPLVTADRRLAALAEQAGVTVEMLATG